MAFGFILVSFSDPGDIFSDFRGSGRHPAGWLACWLAGWRTNLMTSPGEGKMSVPGRAATCNQQYYKNSGCKIPSSESIAS